jgi:hypothetical protein
MESGRHLHLELRLLGERPREDDAIHRLHVRIEHRAPCLALGRYQADRRGLLARHRRGEVEAHRRSGHAVRILVDALAAERRGEFGPHLEGEALRLAARDAARRLHAGPDHERHLRPGRQAARAFGTQDRQRAEARILDAEAR